MPLVRANNEILVDAENGISFRLFDGERQTSVLCRISREALDERASFDGQKGEWADVWRKYREAIEALASAKFDAEGPQIDGSILVATGELTPLSREPGHYLK